MSTSLYLVYFTILLALMFDFLNGFHDASNAIATVVSTHVLKPYQAVIWAATFNFLAIFIFGLHVASTIGTGIVIPGVIDTPFVLCALFAAIVWNIITWYFGIPSSSSHALIGGMVGAALAKQGSQALIWSGLLKIIAFIIISPLLGFVLGLGIMFILVRIFYYHPPTQIDHMFRRAQLFSSALLSLGHGGNDAQKSIGIIAILLYSEHLIGPHFYVPDWVIISCYLTMALGTLFGGYRIVKTMGMKITKLKPIGGSSAELSGAVTMFLASELGIPVSTTHTITGAIIGVGSLQCLSAVRWGVAGRIVWAWILTIPATATLSAIAQELMRL